ncbi:hypothetical protein J7K18_07240 [bacterium]|nr:hypothetical protein [bacterium]
MKKGKRFRIVKHKKGVPIRKIEGKRVRFDLIVGGKRVLHKDEFIPKSSRHRERRA